MEDLTKKWVENHYQGLSFVMNKGVLEIPIKLGMIELYQVGEIGLNDGGKVFEHTQVCNEISYIISGEGYFTVNGVKTKVKKGDIFVVGSDVIHEVEAEKYTNFRYSYIGFKLNEDLDSLKYASLIEFYSKPPVAPEKDSLHIHYALDTMIDELYAEYPYSSELFDACATQLLIQCMRLYEIKNKKYYIPEIDKKIIGEIAYDVMRYIDSQVFEIKSVSNLAEKLGYSPDYLTKLFKAKTGMSIQKYMQDKKIDCSMELLKNGKYSVKDIATTLNYESTQAFSKMFKKYTGLTPSEYVKHNNNE